MKRFLSVAASIALMVSGFVSIAPAANANQQANARFSSVLENRSVALDTNFQLESDEFGARFSVPVSFSAAQYAAIGTGKKLTVRAFVKTGSSVVSRESQVFRSSGASVGSPSGNTFTTNSDASPLVLSVELDSVLLTGVNYQVSVAVFVDNVLITAPAGYTVSAASGVFRKSGPSITTTSGESWLSFDGATCLSSAAYSSLQVNDVIEIRVTDSANRTYELNATARGIGQDSMFVSNSGLGGLAVTSAMLTGGIAIGFTAYFYSPTAGLHDPRVSIKKSGTSDELSVLCSTTPSSAPTVTASATGITAAIDLDGQTSARCYLADARFPNLVLTESFVFSGAQTCSFQGIKRGDYVVWYQRFMRVSQTNSTEVSGASSPKSVSVTYAGGNGTFRTFTGTSGGSGQGSLTLSEIGYVGSDAGTERRVSDGNGGVLVGSIEGADNEYKLRRLTPTGMSSTFGGAGAVTIALPPYNQRTASGIGASASLGWYGAAKDKWVGIFPGPATPSLGPFSQGFFMSSTTVIATGEYGSSAQSVVTVSTLELSKFCGSVVTGAGNSAESFSGSSFIRQIVSAPAADPLMVVECSVVQIDGGNTSRSAIPYLASFDGTNFSLKAALADVPSSAEKCSRTIISAANSGATGSEVMIASYQVTFNPTSGSNCSISQALPSANVVSRDVFAISSSYAVTASRNVITVGATNEPGVFFSGSASTNWRLVVSGPNTHLLTQERSGVFPNTISKYQVARLTAGSFGVLEQLPYLTVAASTEFSGQTNFTQISDYSENVAGSLLLSRADFTNGNTASRVNLANGELTNYQQMSSTSATDGGSLILGNASGALNFYGINSRTTAVLGQWVTSGAFDSVLATLPINQGAANTGVSAPVLGGPGPVAPSPSPSAEATPYTGPVVNAPATLRTVGAGAKVKLDGSNLSGVSKVTIDGKDAKVKVNSEGELEITVPAGLAKGTYDLVVTSDSGVLTVQDGIRVDGSASSGESPTPSTKLKEDNTVKVWVFDVVGAGKIQIRLNGVEVAWINTADPEDAKLLNEYFVRTLTLGEGKNVIEIFVNGERITRIAHTLRTELNTDSEKSDRII